MHVLCSLGSCTEKIVTPTMGKVPMYVSTHHYALPIQNQITRAHSPLLTFELVGNWCSYHYHVGRNGWLFLSTRKYTIYLHTSCEIMQKGENRVHYHMPTSAASSGSALHKAVHSSRLLLCPNLTR